MQHAASMHVISPGEMTAINENCPYEAPGDATGVAATAARSSFAGKPGTKAGAAAIHGSEGGGGLQSGGVAGDAGAWAAEGLRMETKGDGIPNITMRDAFLLGSGKAYGRAVDILMLLNSYYLAFFTVYFISRATKSSTEWVWIIVLPLPILYGVLMAYRRVLPLIALLSTIVMVQATDVADVREQCCAAELVLGHRYGWGHGGRGVLSVAVWRCCTHVRRRVTGRRDIRENP